MKKIFLLVVPTLLFVMFGVYLIRIENRIKFDTLYPESVLDKVNSNKKEQRKRYTRSQAVDQFSSILEDGYKIDLTDEKIEKYTNLYHDKERYHRYVWVMSWTNYRNNDTYTCTIDAETGTVLYLYVGIEDAIQSNKVQEAQLSYEKVIRILSHFGTLIDIDLSKYDLEVNYPVKDQMKNFWQQKCFLYKKDSKEKVYILTIDCNAKFVREFEVTSKEET